MISDYDREFGSVHRVKSTVMRFGIVFSFSFELSVLLFHNGAMANIIALFGVPPLRRSALGAGGAAVKKHGAAVPPLRSSLYF